MGTAVTPGHQEVVLDRESAQRRAFAGRGMAWERVGKTHPRQSVEDDRGLEHAAFGAFFCLPE